MRTTHLRSTSLIAILLASAGISYAASGCSTSADGTADADGGIDAGTEDTGSIILPGPDATVADSGSTGVDAAPGSPDTGPTVDSGPHDGGGAHDSGIDAGGEHDASAPDAADAADVADAADASTLPALLGAWNFDDAVSDDGGASAEAGTAPDDAGTSPDAATGSDAGLSSVDLSGNGHPALLLGGASFGAGKAGGGLVLDGTSGYADLGMTLIDTTKSFSVMAWAKLNVVNNWEIAISEDDVNGSLFGLKLRGDGTNAFDFDVETTDSLNPGFVVAQATSTGQVGAWVHLAGVYDASGSGAVKMYVNGALEANAAAGQPLLGATGHFLIGRGLYNDVTGSFLNGTLDEVAVYGGALTDAQVAAIYTAQQ